MSLALNPHGVSLALATVGVYPFCMAASLNRASWTKPVSLLRVTKVASIVLGAICAALTLMGWVYVFDFPPTAMGWVYAFAPARTVIGWVHAFRVPFFVLWCISYLACFASVLASILVRRSCPQRTARLWPYYAAVVGLLCLLVLVGAAALLGNLLFLLG